MSETKKENKKDIDIDIEINTKKDQKRKSYRTKKPVVRFVPIHHSGHSRKRSRKEFEHTITSSTQISEKKKETKNENEILAGKLSSILTPIFFMNISTYEENIHKRSHLLKQSLQSAVQFVKRGLVYCKSPGIYLITSLNRESTYTIQSYSQSNIIHYTCNCGKQFNSYDRTTCKHIFAVCLFHLNSMISMFYQVISTPEMAQDLNDIETMMEKLGINESEDNHKKNQHDFSIEKPIEKPNEKPNEKPIDYFSSLILKK